MKLINHYGGSIFACAKVVGQSEHFEKLSDDGARHFQGRIFAPYAHVNLFQRPLGGFDLKELVTLSTGGTCTPLLGKNFESVRAALAKNNDLPDYLVNARPGGASFAMVDRSNWMEIICEKNRKFIDESQVRAYFLDYLVEELKDPRTQVLEECSCYRGTTYTGRADYFVRIGGRWLPIEAKLSIACEENVLTQSEKYTNITSFAPTRGVYRDRSYSIAPLSLCLIADSFGLYLVRDGRFLVGEPGARGCAREEITPDMIADIRSALIEVIRSVEEG